MMMALALTAPDATADDVVDDTTIDDDDSRPWFHGTTEAQRKRGRDIFLEGNKLIAIPAYARAAAKFREAIEVWENPAFHYNLAIAQINLLQGQKAYQSLKKAIRFGAQPLGEDKHESALEFMRSLESQLSRVKVTCEQDGVIVTLDGKPLFACPGNYIGFMQPGAHQLVARKDGYNTENRELVGSPGEEVQVDLRLYKPDQVLTVRKWAAWKPWAVVAGGAALLAGSAYFDFSSSSGFDDFDGAFLERCPMGCQSDQIPVEFNDQLDSARGQQNIARITYTIGGLAMITGVALLYVNRERVIRIKGERPDAEPAPSISERVSVTPVVTQTQVGISTSIDF